MQNGLHIIGLGFQRLGILVGLIALGLVLSYVALVFGIVVVQAVTSFGQ